ncbi:MAG: ribonuclease P protein component [Enterococcus sp.]|nr:ribonuclease P protein component [Enterococcus sp.]
MKLIKSKDQISELFKTGQFIKEKNLSIIYKNDQEEGVAFIAGKKLGNAVWRNKAKRRMRELVRINDFNSKDKKLLLIANKNTTKCKFSELNANFNKLIDKI